jgi:hypothetical protein
MELFSSGSLSCGFRQLADLLTQPRNGRSLTPGSIAFAIRVVDRRLELGKIHDRHFRIPTQFRIPIPGPKRHNERNKKGAAQRVLDGPIVGKAGFEPAASTSRTWRAAKLRYFPIQRLLRSSMLVHRHRETSRSFRFDSLAVSEFFGIGTQIDN